MPNLKTTLSKLKPEQINSTSRCTKDNNVSRCHYIKVSNECYIYVETEKQQMLDNEIIVFDDLNYIQQVSVMKIELY